MFILSFINFHLQTLYMKQINFLLFLLSLSALVFTSAKCRKDKNNNPVDQLPPETQTGANTFGCLVNGKVFKPGGASLTGGSLSCNFQNLGTGTNGGFYFRLAAINRNNNIGESRSIGIFTDSLEIISGGNYSFVIPGIRGTAYALYGYSKVSPTTIDDYETNNLYSGKLVITKLDESNQIVSGTFWFDAINANGGKVEIRQGRFDMRYSR